MKHLRHDARITKGPPHQHQGRAARPGRDSRTRHLLAYNLHLLANAFDGEHRPSSASSTVVPSAPTGLLATRAKSC